MQTEDATNPGAEEDVRVLDQQGVDQTDDNSITVDDDHDDDTEDSGADEGEEHTEGGTDGDSEEIDWEDGQKYRVPKALKDGFLRQADYTAKTQAVAEEKRQLAARVTQWEAQSEELTQAQALKLTIDNRLKEIDSLTDAQWDKLHANDPAKASALEREARRLRDQAGQIDMAVADYTSKLTAEQETERSNLRTTMFSEVQKKVPNWTDQLGDEVASFAISEFGISPEALKNLTDAPSLLVLHRAYEGSKALKAQRETLKHAKRQQTAPASTVRGTSGRFAVKPDTDDFAAFEKLADEKLAGKKR